jgi:hypothetical protein
MAMWPRVDVELVEDFYAESPWRARFRLRIHTDVPLDESLFKTVDQAMRQGLKNGDFAAVLKILEEASPVRDRDMRDPEDQRAYNVLAAALRLPATQSASKPDRKPAK